MENDNNLYQSFKVVEVVLLFRVAIMHHRTIGGKDKYVFKRYSAAYKRAFEKESSRLYAELGHENEIEHIGSTAVPGLGGKNILDVIVGLKKGKCREAKRMLQNIGYDFVSNAGSARRLFFVKDEIFDGRSIRVHLHLIKFNGSEWKQKIAFRNYLRNHKETALEYASVKKKAVKEAKGSKKKYMKAKESFINQITREALREQRTEFAQ